MVLSLADLVVVALVGAVAWYWFSSTRVRELAIAAARRTTREADLQLLDQSVALARVSFSKDRGGRWRMWRMYRFEYSRDGVARENGQIMMLGQQLQAVVVAEPPTLH
ncbi:MAG: hypothetical protein ACI87W_001239 [Halieaceae bacterium]|jgi:hypothetical protein